MIRKLIFTICILTAVNHAQILSWSPVYLTDQDSVEIYYDATQGNAGLLNYTGEVYAHTGVLTNLSGAPNDWKYVKTNWGVNTPETKLQRISANMYKLVIRPTIRAYYGVPVSEIITDLAFVFRSGVRVNGNFLEGKTSTGGDIFLPLGLGVNIITPANQLNFVSIGDTVKILAVTSDQTQSMELYIDNTLTYSVTTDTMRYNIPVTDNSKKRVKIVAIDNSGPFSADSFYFMVIPDKVFEPLPSGIEYGINYNGQTSVTLALMAPLKQNIFVIGDFNDWEVDPAYFMKTTPNDSVYWLQIDGLTPGVEYSFQYLVNGSLRIADPYAEKILDPGNDRFIPDSTYPNLKSYPLGKTNEIVSILQTAQTPYQWQVTDFQKPAKTDLVIYELLIRDFVSDRSYDGVMSKLDYLQELGINAIELMPIGEFEGNVSWGYNPSFYFAPDKYYGTKNKLKEFIDECHSRGIAVILDVVFNHMFGQSPLVRLYASGNYGPPTSSNPWFNVTARHPFNVGYDMNHESPHTKYLVDRAVKHWLTEYKIDGFRFDLSKGFTQRFSNDVGQWGLYDQSRINILKRIADNIWSVDSSAYVILEHFADNSEETVLSNYGMMLWGNMNHQYNEATMGYNSDLSGTWYKGRGWTYPHLVSYMESHDEERLMFKNLQYGNSSGNYNVKDLHTAFNRIKMASVFFYLIPGPKMLWQFGELGYDYSINWPSGTGDDRLTPKPVRWDYFDEPLRFYIYRVTQELIKLKTSHEVFHTQTIYTNLAGRLKRINLIGDTLNFAIIGNFDVIPGQVNPNFRRTGTWYEYFSGEERTVSNTQELITLQPGEYKIYSDKKLETPPDGILLGFNEDELPAVAEDFRLFQNYPNPFNPATVISYNLPETSFISIKIFNMLGEEIKTLFSGDKERGLQFIQWNGDTNFGSAAPSGVYFYRVEAGKFSQTKKMILIR